MKTINYRPEIDGLRSIAVLAVILFHSKFSMFSHGFFGVDIFFVISGYLITKILIENKFDFKDFYERRVRRIVPNYFLILFISSIIIYQFNPDIYTLREFSKSSYFSISFLSNYFFMANDYFQQNISRPFLHTWSLSIEEQFYIFYPLFLFFFKNISRNLKISLFLVLITLNIILVNSGGNLKLNYPFFEEKILFFSNSVFFNFYSPLSRLWEFLFGALAYFIYLKKKNNLYSNFILIVSYLLIFYSLTFQSEFLFYPNIFSLLPVCSTFLIIVLENNRTFTFKIISNKVLTYIGLRSFSLYLWHLPIYEIYGYLGLDTSNYIIYLFYITNILVLSEVTFKLVEKPFRKKDLIDFRSVLSFIFLFTILSILVNQYYDKKLDKKNLNFKNFSIFSFGESLKNYEMYKKKILNDHEIGLNTLKTNFKENDLNKILIVGDSVSQDLVLALNNSEFSKSNEFRYYNYGLSELILKRKNDIKIFQSSLYNNADIIIFSYNLFANNLSSKQLNERIVFTKKISNILKQDNKKAIFAINSPNFETTINPLFYLIEIKKINNESSIGREMFKLLSKKFHSYKSELIDFLKKNKIDYIDLFDIYCNSVSEICKYISEDSNILFSDNVHLTPAGKIYLGGRLYKTYGNF
ncbi:acyltransferase family protein [Candidatus Pelagibacter sp.]|uniref:acyltransferase family protein n=1 Tax=Candidatus Pelagibacter sp. TaxID=2024849 RepID=UPI003F8462AE